MATAAAPRRSPADWAGDLWASTSTANKLAVAGILVVVLLALAGLAFLQSQAAAGRVAILDGYKFTSDESRAALQAFGTANLRDYEYVGGQILVPAQRMNEYLQALASADAFRDNFDKPIDDYINNQRTWWASQSDAERLLQIAKTKTVGKMIAAMDGVEEAVVVLAAPDRMTLRRTGRAKASVAVTARRNLSASEVEQIKQMVAGSFQELDPNQVTVTVTNQTNARGGKKGCDVDTCLVKSRNEYLQTKAAYAEMIEQDIRRLLADLDGVEVVANVDLATQDDIQQRITSFGKGAISSQETTSKSSEAPVGAGPAGGEPGVRTNVDLPGTPPANQGLTAAAAPPPTATESDDTSSTRFDNNRIETTQKIHGLIPKQVGVVINIPRQYLEAATGADGQPAPAPRTEQDIIDAVVRLGYAGLTAENVKILRYSPPPPPEPTAPAAIDRVVTVARDYGGSALLAALALVAVLFAWWIARSSSVPKLVEPEIDESEETEKAAEALLPQVPSTEAARRFEKMQDSVTQIISNNPEGSASLLRRWLQQD